MHQESVGESTHLTLKYFPNSHDSWKLFLRTYSGKPSPRPGMRDKRDLGKNPSWNRQLQTRGENSDFQGRIHGWWKPEASISCTLVAPA